MLALKNVVFASLPVEIRTSLTPLIRLIEVKSGAALDENSQTPNVYFPITAVASQMAIVDDGEGVFLQFLGANKTIGFAFENSQFTTKFCHKWCCSGYVFAVPARHFRSLLAPGQEPAFLAKYANVLLRRTMSRLNCSLLHCANQRLARTLLEALDVNDGPELIGASHHMLAGIVGTRRETVSTALGKWQSAGILELAREKIVVKNINELQFYSCPCYRENLKIDLEVREYVSSLLWRHNTNQLISRVASRSLQPASILRPIVVP